MPDLFSTGLSGLAVARTALMTTAHNTANVYTEGYSRQRVVVQANEALATGAGFIGTGARAASVQRSYDDFLAAQLSQAQSAATGLDTYSTQIGRIDNLLADSSSGLSALMQGFFAGVQGVSDTPADPAARQQLLSSGEALAGKFRSVDAYLNDLDGSLNDQIDESVKQVNAIASQVASLNQQISRLAAATQGQPPNDLLDARDKLVADLGKLVSVTVVRQDGGQYNLFVGNGHTLVLGDRAATMTSVPSSADRTRRALALQSASGGTTQLRDGDVSGGTLGGLLAFRSQALTVTQNAVGRLATALASAFNAQHKLGVDLLGNPGGDFFSLGAPQAYSNQANQGTLGNVDVSIADAGQLTTSDYEVKFGGAPGALTFTVTRLADGQQVAASAAPAADFTSVSFEGVTVAAPLVGTPPQPAGVPNPGDSFLVMPTRRAARDIALQVTDPAAIAAGQAAGGAAVSDGSNALALAAIGRQNVVAGGTVTLNGAYARLVSDVGNRAMEVQVASGAQSSLAGQVRTSLQSVAGVNQDEETGNLLMYQQMYQANAKVIQAASTIFDTILGLR